MWIEPFSSLPLLVHFDSYTFNIWGKFEFNLNLTWTKFFIGELTQIN